MKSIILLIFITGIIFFIHGYYKQFNKFNLKKIQYRYIPKNLYDQQMESVDLKKLYSDMFNKKNTWSTYPFNDNLYDYNNNNFKKKIIINNIDSENDEISSSDTISTN